MKRAIIIIGIFILIIGIFVSSILSCRIFMAENKEIENLDNKIPAEIKFKSIIHGGYYNLYIEMREEGLSNIEALNYISAGLGDKLYKESLKLNKQPVNAAFEFTGDYNNPFKYTHEIAGKVVDMDKFCEDTALSLDEEIKVKPQFKEVSADIKYKELINTTAFRAEFTTKFSTSSDERKNNIALAAKFLNGHKIEPQCSMSFNSVVGPRTLERGFLKANIIMNGEMILGTGGGVCQVSSTVYNTCLLSGLNVVSANRHSRTVAYIPASRDAMVSDTSDLIVSNTGDYPVYIFTYTDANKIKIAVYGEKLNEEYRIRCNICSKIIPPEGEKITVSGENISSEIREALLSNDIEKLKDIKFIETVQEAREGIISEAYLDKYVDNKLINTQLISHDIYAPQQREIKREVINGGKKIEETQIID